MTEREILKFDDSALKAESELYENPLTDKQRDIITAAEKLFNERGFNETTTSEIAREAGVTERTLFKHFRQKSDLLRRILFPIVARVLFPIQMKRVRRVIESDYSSYEAFVRELIDDRIAMASEHGEKMKLMLDELLFNGAFRKQVSEMRIKEAWTALVAQVKNFQKRGELRRDVSAESIARMQLFTIMGYLAATQILSRELKWEKEKELEELVQILSKGVQVRKVLP